MKTDQVGGALALVMVLLIAQAPWLDLQAGNASLGKVTPQGPAELNRVALLAESSVFSGDTVTTAAEGWALVFLAKGDRVQVGPASEVRLIEAAGVVVASLERGSLQAQNGGAQSLMVQARGLLVNPAGGARYHVALVENGVVVSADQGTVNVQGTNRSYTVSAGQAMRFEVTAAPQAPAGAGSGGSGIAPGAAAGIAAAIAVGATLAIAIPVYNNQKDDIRDACQAALRALSPSAAIPSQCR